MACADWINRASVPIMLTSNIVNVNNKEFIAIHRTFGVYKYNITHNKWNLFAKFPTDYESKEGEILIDHPNNTLYIANIYEQYLIVFDLNNNTFAKVHHNIFHICSRLKLVMMDKLHIITDHRYLHQWNNGTFDDLFLDKFKFDDIVSENSTGFHGFYKTQWLPSKRSLMILGGTVVDFHNLKGIDNIYFYQPAELKMIKTKHKLPTTLCQFGHILTRDEQYLILFGGKTCMGFGHLIDDIFILNIELMSITKSKVKCPQKGCFDAVYRYDEIREDIITFGFIRDCWKNKQFENMEYPPYYICGFIKSWFAEEFIHLIANHATFNQRNHFQINIDHIFT